jgi:hypothetical protein
MEETQVTNTPHDDGTVDDTAGSPDHESPPGMPRWVKVFGIVAVVVVLLIVVLLIAGGGSHGPGRHTGTGGEHQSGSAAGAHATPEEIGATR